MSKKTRKISLKDVSEITGLDDLTVTTYIQREWIYPVSENELDQEDLARIELIQELRTHFGVNDEAVPLILHLMDQLYYLHHQLQRTTKKE